VYEAGPWEIDASRRELRARGVPVPIGVRAFEVIETLVKSAGRLVTKDDLMAQVWPGVIVEENTLQVHISAIRKALGADRGMLKTVSGRGYRLLGTWTIRQEDASAELDAPERARVAAHPFQTNVPVAASALIGREAAVQHLGNLLSAYRVVTLTGPGGIGKTVLAAEVARRLFPTIQSDVLFVELVSLSDPGLVPSTVARVLGLELGGDVISAESVARAVGGRQLLLVLDNCEHVVDQAASLAETLLRVCPRTSILATSREVMRIEGEFVYLVPPLDVPPQHQQEAGEVLEHSAVQLFMARTRSLLANFSAEGENLPVIAAICRRLDGIPLALEFAAARAATLGVQQVAGRLDDRFALLTVGRRTALPRHHTLRATLDWSYELLPEPERRLLRRLAVFPAGFTLEAATAVMSDGGNAASAVMAGISNLVAKSLVTLDGSVPGGRWRMLETIRAYALEKLAESGESHQAARHHAEFFRDLFAPATGWSFSMVGDSAQRAIDDLTRHAREIDNVRAALDWSFSSVGDAAIGVVLTAAYAPVWLHSALLVECRERTERALECLAPDMSLSAPLLMQLHMALGFAGIMTMRSVEKNRIIVAKALEVAESLDDLDAQQRALWGLWILHTYSGECRAAQSIAERLSRVAARSGDPAVILMADRITGNTLQYGGDHRAAQRRFERVIELCVEPRDRPRTFWVQLDQRVLARATLARALLLQGYVDQAIGQAQASLEEARATDYNFSICEALRLAVYPVALMTGDSVAAERAVATLIDIASSCHGTFWRIVGSCLKGKLLIKQGEFAAGTVLLRSQLDACEKTGWAIWYPEFMGALAEGLAGLGRLPEALVTVDQALAKADRGGERYYVAELLRIKGEFLLQEAGEQSMSAAEDCFEGALEVARQQGALLLELRAALSLAGLRLKQHRPDEARQILAPVYGRFTEGFETPDMRSAKAALEAMSPR
jgi:predicted ATPase/DNA-binding winged helix-turn-helix (wHTH) protein